MAWLHRATIFDTLDSWVKTTGGRGVHVVVPIRPKRDWHECLAFARDVPRPRVVDDVDGAEAPEATEDRPVGEVIGGRVRTSQWHRSEQCNGCRNFSDRRSPPEDSDCALA